MSTALICICGLPIEQHGRGMTDHPYIVEDWARGLRDTQTLRKGKRAGHYSIKEQRIVVSAVPAAGADVSASVPQNGKWKVWGLRAQLTTGAAVANRIPHIQITDGPPGHIAFDAPANNNQVAATTITYTSGASPVAANFDNTVVIVCPVDITLLGNWKIQTATTGIQAADQWTALTLYIAETLYF